MTDAFVVETQGLTAGIAVRDGKHFQFYASDTRFSALDNRRFGSLRDVHATIDEQIAEHRHRLSRREARNTLVRRQQMLTARCGRAAR